MDMPKLREKRVSCLPMLILRRTILQSLQTNQMMRLQMAHPKVDNVTMYILEMLEEKMTVMLMMKARRVLTGHLTKVIMPQKMEMCLPVSQVMVRIAPLRMETMIRMAIRPRVRARLKEWQMHMKMEMEYHCLLQNIFCTQLSHLQSMLLEL
uniref:Uncharacterized protein n=1 Tax=Opuntia streptacantha TaxID=393608 RepID=A0A7C9EV34_OPUST